MEFDMNIGSIYLEIPIMLSGESIEGKHFSLEEQGLFLAYGISGYLKQFDFQGAALSEIKYWGTSVPSSESKFRRIDFNQDL